MKQWFDNNIERFKKAWVIGVTALLAILALFNFLPPEIRVGYPQSPQTISYLTVTKNATVLGTLAASTLVSSTISTSMGDGTVLLPSWTFTEDPNTGLYRIGADNVGIATAGAKVFDCSSTGCTSSGTTTLTGATTHVGRAIFAAGTAAAPTIYITGDSNTGLYQVAADQLGISTGGALIFDCSATGCTSAGTTAMTGIASIGNGTAAAPSLAFTSDPNTGIYRAGADQIGLATNGVNTLDCNTVSCTNRLALSVIGAQTNSAALSAVGITSSNGLTVTGSTSLPAVTAVGLTSSNGMTTTTGTLKGPAEGNIVVNTWHSVTAAEIHTGHILVTVPTGRSFRLVSLEATATVATCTTSTNVYVKGGTGGAVTLVDFTTANLVRNTLLKAGTSTGTAVLADAASFAVQTAATNVIVDDGATGTTAACTVVFDISYVLE